MYRNQPFSLPFFACTWYVRDKQAILTASSDLQGGNCSKTNSRSLKTTCFNGNKDSKKKYF